MYNVIKLKNYNVKSIIIRYIMYKYVPILTTYIKKLSKL